jgi:hypothetical protein
MKLLIERLIIGIRPPERLPRVIRDSIVPII